MNLLVVLLLPFIGALLPAPVLRRHGATAAAWATAVAPALALLVAAPALLSVFHGRSVAAGWAWLPLAGLDFLLRLDGLAALFVLLVLGMGLLIILYAHQYLHEGERIGRF